MDSGVFSDTDEFVLLNVKKNLQNFHFFDLDTDKVIKYRAVEQMVNMYVIL